VRSKEKRETYNDETEIVLVLGVDVLCLTPLSLILQLFHGGQFYFVKETGMPGKKH